ncbi:MAG: hypothetical protein A3C02_03740, partial [Candidatus Andersenbacteria bacterium RIFCSPHIGHO2_02_FULL_45_11]
VMMYGPRRVGKTTMLKTYLAELPADVAKKYDVGDDIALRQLFGSRVRKDILDYAAPYDVLGIDEAQQIPNLGEAIKMIIDEFPEKKIILTGSSSFDLAQSVGEPLVGRHYAMQLYPPAWKELAGSDYEKKQHLEEMLLYGSYPEILLADTLDKKQIKLKELTSSYLFKDILSFERLKSPELLLKILQALAWQIGGEVSLNELAKTVGESDHKKIGRYIELLEKSFVIKKIHAHSTNQRKEIKTKVKYFFYDLGVRNAIIGNFQKLALREPKDIGMLWENFVYIELVKKSELDQKYFDDFYFWRTRAGREVDIVQKTADGDIVAYECKWSFKKVVFSDFLKIYPKAKTEVASQENIADILR